jgi:hypothetical protein
MTLPRRKPEKMEAHAGKLIAQKVKELKFSKAEVARRINRPASNIPPLLKQRSMQAYILWELSIALDYDFFSAISQALIEKHPTLTGANASAQSRIASLEKELAAMKEERDYLKKIIDVWAK